MLVLMTGILFLSASCTRQEGLPRNTLATAEETVKAYCDLDANGARLTSATWNKVLPYISWSEEAGFDRAIVIAGFAIGQVQMKSDREHIVPVAYQVMGTVAGEYAAGRRTENVRYRVARTDRGWKIMEPDFLPPHVLADVMVRHLTETQQSEMAEKVKNDS
jgi:hypothetical protein